VKLIRNLPHLLLIAGLGLVLSACSGGAATTPNPNAQTAAAASYAGPVPGTADVQAFKVNLWQYINTANRCGNCHKAGGQSPMFARADDVNLAYNDALGVVNLAQPDQSRMVIKVAGGHNCWLASAQSCADILTTWIKNWAGGVAAAGGTQIQLQAPTIKDVGSTKTFPATANDNGGASFATTIYPLLSQHCSRCHSAGATTPQTPYFASSDVNEAYANAQAKINLDTPALSRFYVRLHDESHNCWIPLNAAAVSCPQSSSDMLDAINAFVGGINPTQVDPALVLSKALTLYDGTIASGGNRYDTGLIAKWQFKEGSADPSTKIADDTSGVDPALNLTLAGDYSWVGGWGVRFGPNGGEARGGGGGGACRPPGRLPPRRRRQPQAVRHDQDHRRIHGRIVGGARQRHAGGRLHGELLRRHGGAQFHHGPACLPVRGIRALQRHRRQWRAGAADQRPGPRRAGFAAARGAHL
jgi:mono/diheme cytochrome c family protein